MEQARLLELAGALGLGGIVATAITAFAARPKTSAEAAKIRAEVEVTINKAALELIESLRTEVANMRGEIDSMRARGEECEERNRKLRTEVDLLKRHIGVCENELGIQAA